MERGRIVFITGGARSGKSSFAIENARSLPGRKVYVATAGALDEEMKDRIRKHREERGAEWDTIEEPLELAEAIGRIRNQYSVVLIDCLTLWLSNLLLNSGGGTNPSFSKDGTRGDYDPDHEMDKLIAALELNKESLSIFLVSNEVGMGIVPDNRLARQFRDLAGKLNQKVAGTADEVYMVVSGIPVRIK